MLSSFLALSLAALAAPSSQSVLAQLESTSGWSTPSDSSGVMVSTKAVPGLSVPAYRGTRTVDVSCDAYFVAVADPTRHKAVNSMLLESGVDKKEGEYVVFHQVLDIPIISDRYWINRARNQKNLGGVVGHHRQTWSGEPRESWTALADRIEADHGAVFVGTNYGFWDLVPTSTGGCTITYAVVSDPGGSLPSGASSWASGKSLPNNINSFYAAAKGG